MTRWASAFAARSVFSGAVPCTETSTSWFTPTGATRRAAVLVAAFTLGRETSYADAAAAERPAYRTVTVAPGQTMWEVARQAAPEQDPRVIVQRIIDLNGLSGASLTAGQELAVPLGG